MSDAAGLQGYVAPEVLTNERHYDSKLSDVWSSGVMLYAMLYCRYPFERPEDQGNRRREQLIMQRACAGRPPLLSTGPLRICLPCLAAACLSCW